MAGRLLNPPVPHQARRKLQEALVILHLPLVPDSQAPVVVKPGVAPLDNPASRGVLASPLLLANATNVRDVAVGIWK
jgi:hypothetical protein